MKKQWWLWLLLALACLVIVFGVSELTGISILSIFGLGTLGVLGVVALIIGIPFAITISFGFAYIIAQILKLLLGSFISNRDTFYIIYGILGFCAILTGYILNTKFEWSLFIIMVGFFMGCLAGVEYQKGIDTQKE